MVDGSMPVEIGLGEIGASIRGKPVRRGAREKQQDEAREQHDKKEHDDQ